MRTEKDMMALIMEFADRDKRVRVAAMEGSRVNVYVKADRLSDYDLTFVVTEMDSFLRDDAWLDYFGERLIMQKPEGMTLFPPSLGGWFTYLMLFADGNRIDLKLVPLSDLERYLAHDRLIKIILDKDGRVPGPPVPSDVGYHLKEPTAAEFADSCNEFWWVATYVAKGLCRGELFYATEHLDRYVRRELLRMLGWDVGVREGFTVSMGKANKYLDKHLSADMYMRLVGTYTLNSTAAVWGALFTCFDLFREASRRVSRELGFPYPDHDAKVTPYIEKLREEMSHSL